LLVRPCRKDCCLRRCTMNPKIVTIEQGAFVSELHGEMWVRLTYRVDWDADSQQVRTSLLGREVLAEVRADA